MLADDRPDPGWRVALSRRLGRLLFGEDRMVCAIADNRQWSARHALNALFLDRGHCAAAADWEALQAPRYRDPVDRLRRSGCI